MHAIRNLARIGFGTRRAALVPARLRPHVVDLDRAGRRRATCSASRTAPPTSRPRTRPASTSSSGSARATTSAPTGWPAAPTSSPAGSACASRPWDRTCLSEQETLIGRDQERGRPAVRRQRVHRARLHVAGPRRPLIAVDSHVRLAHPSTNNGVRLLRRGYNFTDGTDDLGRLDAGLFFIAFVRDPDEQYIPMQTSSRARTG